MKHLRIALLTLLAIPLAVAAVPAMPTGGVAVASAAQDEVVGDWAGALDLGSASLRVVFHISRSEDGALSATMDSPDQGAFGIAVDSTSFEDRKLTMSIAAVAGGYEGTLQDDGSLQGTWSQGGQSLPLNLTRQKE